MITFKQFLSETKRDKVRASKLVDYIGKRYDKKNTGEMKTKKSVGNEEERNYLKLHKSLVHNDEHPTIIHKYKKHFENEKETHDLPIKDLKLTQDRVYRKGVKDKIDSNDDPISVIRHGGHHYVVDGHHRYTAEKLKGKTHIKAKVIDSGH